MATAVISEKNTSFDIVIAGGGLSGALMAISLASVKHPDGQPLTIAIIEAQPIHHQPSLTFDDRVLALAHSSARYLAELNVWSMLKADATAIEKIHISDRSYYGKARLNAQEHGVAALGYVVEMSLLGKALLTQLATFPHIRWYAPETISDIVWQADCVNVTLSSGCQLTTSLLLACDGANSRCRQLANIDMDFHDYQQTAVIANVSTSKPHHGVAFERFTEQGPLAMLPLSKGRCSLVWTMTPTQAAEITRLDDKSFAQRLSNAFGRWLGDITQVGQRSCFGLSLVRAKTPITHRLALIGNAAHTIHPIAGQGFNLGLRDIACLKALIGKAVADGGDIGQLSLLDSYATQREVDHQRVITFTDALVTLFSNQLPPLVAGRNVALKAINYLTPIKNLLVQKTMGY